MAAPRTSLATTRPTTLTSTLRRFPAVELYLHLDKMLPAELEAKKDKIQNSLSFWPRNLRPQQLSPWAGEFQLTVLNNGSSCKPCRPSTPLLRLEATWSSLSKVSQSAMRCELRPTLSSTLLPKSNSQLLQVDKPQLSTLISTL